MSELAIIEPAPVPAARIDSWVSVVADVAMLAERIQQTDFVPRSLRGNAPAITAAILYGREVGLPPMQSLRWVHVIEGSPALAAESQRALVLAAGHELVFPVATGSRCVARGRRRGAQQWHEVEWTTDTARQAGLLGGGPRSAWNKYPRAMLKARASAELCRDIFADVTGGFAAVEEFGVMPEEGAARAVEAPAEATGTVRRGRPRKAASEAPTVASEAPREGSPAEEDADSGQVHSPPAPNPSRPPSIARAHKDMRPAEPPGEHDGWADVPLPGVIEEEEPATDEQGRYVFRLLGELGVRAREERLDIARAVLLRRVESFGELSKSEAHKLIEALTILAATESEREGEGRAQLAAIVAHWALTEPAPLTPEPPFDEVTGEVLE
jgi:hypothetical protein